MKRILLTLTILLPLAATAQRQMTLGDCIAHAVAHNVDVKKQDVVRRGQELNLHTARHSRLPQLSASGSQSFDFGRSLSSANTYVSRNTQSTAFSLSANLPLITCLLYT
ncbi:MAG TPA: TolC family protein, partial [Candidatus Caccomonas pullistercoris]|nr:TolC family protein [Candidatus Caccomonas pullistercoris]